MILAAGLTPAWQQIVCLDALRPGEVNRAQSVEWCASGKVLNVGVALANLQAECRVLAPLGGAPGASIEREFLAAGIPGRWIHTETPTRVCTTILEARGVRTTELVENAGRLEPQSLEQFRTAFAEEAAAAEMVVLTGSLPAETDSGYYRELLASCSVPAILDIRGPELLAALEAVPLVVKPNREELARTLGRSLDSDHKLLLAMRELCSRGAAWVVVTSGADAVWMASAAETFRLQPLRVERVVNPIGCGDCLAAALAWGISRGLEPVAAAQLGLAAAAENAAELLPARLDRSRVLERARLVQAQRV